MKKSYKLMQRGLGIVIIAIIVLSLLLSFKANAADSATDDDTTTTQEDASGSLSWRDYIGKRIGVITGTPLEQIALDYFEDSEILYYDSYPDLSAALLSGYIDAYLGDKPGLQMVCAEQPQIGFIDEAIESNEYCFAFKKDDEKSKDLCEEFNEFLDRIKSDGTFDEIADIWFGTDEDKKVVDMSDLRDINGTIKVVTTSTDMPFSYIKDGQNVGYDIDIVVRFCREAGYDLELMDVDFNGRIPAVKSGKCDFSTDMNATDERREEVLFSDETCSGDIVLAVPSEDLKNSQYEALSQADGVYKSIDELSGKTIGVKQGTLFDEIALESIEDANISYYMSEADEWEALKSGKIDAFVVEVPTLKIMQHDNNELTMVPEELGSTDFAAVFQKSEEGDKLREEFDEYLEKIIQDGTKDQLLDKWLSDDYDLKTIEDYTQYPATNGTIKLATEGEYEPFNYIEDNKAVGYDIELAALFCKEYGYALEIQLMHFDSIIPSVESGKSDMAISALSIDEERAQTVNFSQPYYKGEIIAAVLKADIEETSFIGGIKESFIKTFVKEHRYRLFITGVLTTLLITVLAIAFGTLLGFIIFMACRRGNPVANIIARVFVWLIQGMPIVVLLMILYYIIFAKSDIGGTVVSVVAFTMVFGAGVFGMLKSGVGAVDKGQMEAAYALGFSDLRAFFKIILPQALPHFMPTYKAEVIALIKATAIVGYIAVQDLTKMGDIVRGRTFEAFFPLIAVAIIYFILGGALRAIVNRIEINIDPKQRKREEILKGIVTDK